MKFITAVYFTEDKKPKIMMVENPANSYSAANLHGQMVVNEMKNFNNVTFKTYELGAKNLL